jgi:hypothetical protein
VVTSEGRERPRKKSATKKSATKKPAAEKPAPEKSAARKSGARKTAAKAGARPAPTPVKVATKAAEQLFALTGREAEGVTGLERTDEGWTVLVELVELRRVPTTTDVLGLYEVRTDRRGELLGYRRLRRYSRGASEDE